MTVIHGEAGGVTKGWGGIARLSEAGGRPFQDGTQDQEMTGRMDLLHGLIKGLGLFSNG